MENAIQVFSNTEFGELGVVIIDGKEMFPATDCAKMLGYANPHKAISDHCRYITKREVPHPQSTLKMLAMNFIPESDLYRLIVSSTLPAAERFERWVFDEVLPSIRRHGGYLTPAKLEQVLLHPDTLIKLAQNLKDEQIKRAALEAKVEADAPKVLFADSVAASNKDILVGELAKIICQNGYDIGEKRLYQWLRDNGYLIKDGRSDRNRPMQRYLEMGLFRVSETVISIPDRDPITKFTTRVTPKGQQYFINKFLNGGLKVA